MPGSYFVAIRLSGQQLRHDVVSFYVGDRFRRQKFVDIFERRGGQCEVGGLLPADCNIQEAIQDLVNSFKSCIDMIRQGAEVEEIVLLVRIYPQGAAQSMTLQPSLLADLSLMRIELAFEVFPEMAPGDDQWT